MMAQTTTTPTTLKICKNPECGKTLPAATDKKSNQREYCDDKCRRRAYALKLELDDDDKRAVKMLSQYIQRNNNQLHDLDRAGMSPVADPAKTEQPQTLSRFDSVHESLPLTSMMGVSQYIGTGFTKPWLTLKEAAEFSGLPIGWLRQKCIDGSLGMRCSPSKTHPEWRIQRVDLEGGKF